MAVMHSLKVFSWGIILSRHAPIVTMHWTEGVLDGVSCSSKSLNS